MTHSLKTKWIKALRSGKYEQCAYRLHDGKGYCCLGVLAKINAEKFYRCADNKYCIDRLGGKQFYGIDQKLFPFEIAKRLSVMNDSGRTFTEIADWIEENL